MAAVEESSERTLLRPLAAALDGDLEQLLATMTSDSELSCALRQESPFVDLVDQKERARIYRAVADEIDRRSPT